MRGKLAGISFLILFTTWFGLAFANPPGSFNALLQTAALQSDTWNPSDKNAGTTLSGGNLSSSLTGTEATQGRTVTPHSTAAYYFEILVTNAGSAPVAMVGICNASQTFADHPGGTGSNSYGYYANSGNKFFNSVSGVAYGSTFTTSDIIGVAADLTNGKIWWSKNGTFQASGNPAAGTNAAFTGITPSNWYPCTGMSSGASRTVATTANFGGSTFSFPIPIGFIAGWPK